MPRLRASALNAGAFKSILTGSAMAAATEGEGSHTVYELGTIKTDEQWRDQLTPQQRTPIREEGFKSARTGSA